ncbi:hypothetical protein Q3G72_018292 [Acer saccharum]|nr:hypothetical protein Q3G72_018292 [Acer saccharum]
MQTAEKERETASSSGGPTAIDERATASLSGEATVSLSGGEQVAGQVCGECSKRGVAPSESDSSLRDHDGGPIALDKGPVDGGLPKPTEMPLGHSFEGPCRSQAQEGNDGLKICVDLGQVELSPSGMVHKQTCNVEEEIDKVMEIGVLLAFDFNGKEKELADVIARREEEHVAKFNEVNGL